MLSKVHLENNVYPQVPGELVQDNEIPDLPDVQVEDVQLEDVQVNALQLQVCYLRFTLKITFI